MPTQIPHPPQPGVQPASRASLLPYVALSFFIFSIAVLLTLATLVIFLALPGKPAPSRALRFDGFIELPRHGALTILDYLSIHQNHLYATSITHGTLFDVALHPSGDPRLARVAESSGPNTAQSSAHGVAPVPGQGVAYLTRSGTNTVDLFDLDTLKTLQQIPVPDDPDAILYSPQNHLVYVANGDARMATLIDTDTRVVLGTIPLVGKPEFLAFDPVSGLLYQNLEDRNQLAAINLPQRAIVGRWPLAPCSGPSGMAIDPAARRLFIVCSGNATLVVVNLDTHRVIAALPVGSLPDSVVYDAAWHRLYAAGGAGRLTVIEQLNPDAYRVLDQIHTHFGAHTLALDPATHKLYLAYASLFAPPRLAVFTPIAPARK